MRLYLRIPLALAVGVCQLDEVPYPHYRGEEHSGNEENGYNDEV